MRAKQINHKNGATGSIKPALEKHSMFLTKSANDLGKNIGTSLTGVSVQGIDTAKAVDTSNINEEVLAKLENTPTTPTTPTASSAIAIDTPEVPSAITGGGTPSTITTQQPEVKTQKDYTRLILQVVIAAFAIHWLRTILSK